MSGFSATRLQILTLATLVLFAVGCARDRKGPGESVLSAMPAGQAVASQEQEITPLDFGAVGDGKADDTQPLQAAVDAAISKKIKLTSPMSAVYAIKAPIQVRSTLNADFQMAEIRAAAPMEALLRYETWDRYTLIQNLRLDGNLMADTCLDIVVGSKMRVDNLITGRHRKIALKIAKGNEIFVQNSHINAATPEDNSAESAEDTVGIDIATSDCHFSDIVIIDCKTAIINRGQLLQPHPRLDLQAGDHKGLRLLRSLAGLHHLRKLCRHLLHLLPAAPAGNRVQDHRLHLVLQRGILPGRPRACGALPLLGGRGRRPGHRHAVVRNAGPQSHGRALRQHRKLRRLYRRLDQFFPLAGRARALRAAAGCDDSSTR